MLLSYGQLTYFNRPNTVLKSCHFSPKIGALSSNFERIYNPQFRSPFIFREFAFKNRTFLWNYVGIQHFEFKPWTNKFFFPE